MKSKKYFFLKMCYYFRRGFCMCLVLLLDPKEDYQMYFIQFQTLFYFLVSQTFAQETILKIVKIWH